MRIEPVGLLHVASASPSLNASWQVWIRNGVASHDDGVGRAALKGSLRGVGLEAAGGNVVGMRVSG